MNGQLKEDLEKSQKKILTGFVLSNKMPKTIVVGVERHVAHPIYKKYRAIRKKFKAHDEENTCNVGDRVRIIEHRPISRDKTWKLLQVLQRKVE